jgi:hypothetical protein
MEAGRCRSGAWQNILGRAIALKGNLHGAYGMDGGHERKVE